MADDIETQTPAEELLAAAQRLRNLAANTTPGPWYSDGGEGVYAWGTDSGVTLPAVIPTFTKGVQFDDMNWIAALGPVVAAPLASLLEMAAGAVSAGNFPNSCSRRCRSRAQ